MPNLRVLALLALSLDCAVAKGSTEAPSAIHRDPRVPSHRMMMGEWLEKNGFKRGAEIGVQRGHFAHALLAQWRSCERYIAVDPWREQNAYPDPANAPIDVQAR